MPARCILFIAAVFLQAVTSHPAAQAAQMRTAYLLDGTALPASHARLENDWTLHLRDHQAPVQASSLVYWGWLEENLQQPLVILRDGSRIVADVLEITPQAVTIGTNEDSYLPGSIWQRTAVPRQTVCGIIQRLPADPDQRDRLMTELLAGHADDQAWLENGDRVSGTWLGPFAAAELTDPQQPWRWQLGDRQLTLARTQVMAIGLGQGEATRPAGQGRGAVVGFAEGSQLAAVQLRVSDARVEFELADGTVLATSPGMAWDELCYVRPANPAVVYLSDLEPVGYRHVPLFTLGWPYHRDRNVLGGRLRSGAGLYEKGLGMHSTARLAYDLPPGTERLQLELALDRSAGVQGSVQLRIYRQAGSEPWQAAAESPLVRGGDPPAPLDLDLRGAQRIALILDAADNGQQLDRANILNARLILSQ